MIEASDLESGYRLLESAAQATRRQVVQHHGEAVERWHKTLSLYASTILGPFDFTGSEAEAPAWHLRFQLLGMAAGTSKLALDATLAGYNVQAFSLIRHMLETRMQVACVAIRPDLAPLWYRRGEGLSPQEPKYATIRKIVWEHVSDKAHVDQVHRMITELAKGAHPSGMALPQVAGPSDGKYRLGGAYSETLCVVALERGVYATLLLLAELSYLVGVEEDEPWFAEYRSIHDGHGAWMDANNVVRSQSAD
jgi:hypothetical protein